MNKYDRALKDIYKEAYPNASENWCAESLNDNVLLLKELVERATPKKPALHIIDDTEWLMCPICTWDTKDSEGLEHNYCPGCGQALDWSE